MTQHPASDPLDLPDFTESREETPGTRTEPADHLDGVAAPVGEGELDQSDAGAEDDHEGLEPYVSGAYAETDHDDGEEIAGEIDEEEDSASGSFLKGKAKYLIGAGILATALVATTVQHLLDRKSTRLNSSH